MAGCVKAIVLLSLLAAHALATNTLTPKTGPVKSDPEEELTLFDARGGHTTAENLRSCYDTMRRMTMCPVATKKTTSGQPFIGTKNRQLLCSPREVGGTEIVGVYYMLMRSISKKQFVKNAYFTAPGQDGSVPANQHFTDVFLGQLVFNVLNSADQSTIAALPNGPLKTSFNTLSKPENIWASVKMGFFKGKKERLAIGSTEFRRHLKVIRESPEVLFSACRRTKFVLASMDVGSDVAKYALEKKYAIAKLIHKIVSTALKIGATFVPIGGAAVSAIIGVLSDLVDSAIDASKESKDRKYAVQDLILELLSNMVPPKEETPPIEAMVSAAAAQNTEIINSLKALQAKLAVPPRTRNPRKAVMIGGRRRFLQVDDGVQRYKFQNYNTDPSFLQIRLGGPDAFSTVEYDTGKACDDKVKALLWMVENMVEDEPTTYPRKVPEDVGIETDMYKRINYCGPNPDVMGERENVLRCKAIFKLIKYFITAPEPTGIEATSWFANVMSKADKMVDAASDIYDAVNEDIEAAKKSGEGEGSQATNGEF